MTYRPSPLTPTAMTSSGNTIRVISEIEDPFVRPARRRKHSKAKPAVLDHVSTSSLAHSMLHSGSGPPDGHPATTRPVLSDKTTSCSTCSSSVPLCWRSSSEAPAPSLADLAHVPHEACPGSGLDRPFRCLTPPLSLRLFSVLVVPSRGTRSWRRIPHPRPHWPLLNRPAAPLPYSRNGCPLSRDRRAPCC